jgi:hypothetical protein
MALNVKIKVVWDMTPCSVVSTCLCSFLYEVQGKLRIDAVLSNETLAVPFKFAEDTDLHQVYQPYVLKYPCLMREGMEVTCSPHVMTDATFNFHVSVLLALFCHMWWSLPRFTETLQVLLVSHLVPSYAQSISLYRVKWRSVCLSVRMFHLWNFLAPNRSF